MLDLQVLSTLLERYRAALGQPVRTFTLGGRLFDFNRYRYLVGVINLSTDSWYRESVCATTAEAIARAEMLCTDGAEIIDLGAESTLPHARQADVQQQLERLLPVVEALKARQMLVSVESYYPEVLETCARAGADIFNLTGTLYSEEIFQLAAAYDVAVILCYVQGPTVREVGDFRFHEDMIAAIGEYFRDLTARAMRCGVSKCFLDPGLGFYYKNLQDSRLRVNYQLKTFLHCFRLHELGYPTFNILPHAPEVFLEDERRAAEPFFSVLALLGGTHVIRSHEIRTVHRIRQVMELYES
ncbi:MAG: dihydropteroate synthase [Candidatus Tectomicrobia bacterium]|uniref:Dihydropteroate synthase n=1 Tax=Tectimicrobiota bacterium TaxID=2528274 RepID=A0A937VY46_UNCTE|nr:dihydropteroate synthase [Candidatus Tectomicrobia bacterium]